jgi:hypothetical protein
LRALDQALRASGLHPALVPDAVKLTVLNVLKDAKGEDPSIADYAETSALLGYCVFGHEVFATANGGLAAALASAPGPRGHLELERCDVAGSFPDYVLE